jgi:hypothetical protein
VRGASGSNYAREHPEVVPAVTLAASLDWAAMTIAATSEEESVPRNNGSGLEWAQGLVRP